MANIIFNLKKQYFDDIKNGNKKEEYRLCTPYWQKRLENKKFNKIEIRLGYPKNSEENKILIFPWRGYTIKKIKHPHFGIVPVEVYAIKIEK